MSLTTEMLHRQKKMHNNYYCMNMFLRGWVWTVIHCQSASQARMTDKAAWTPFQMVVFGFYGALRQRRRGNLEIL